MLNINKKAIKSCKDDRIIGAKFDTHAILHHLQENGFPACQVERENGSDFDDEISISITGRYADVQIIPGVNDVGLTISITSFKCDDDGRLYKSTDAAPRLGTFFNSVFTDDAVILMTINYYLEIASNAENFCYIGKDFETSKFSQKDGKKYYPFTHTNFAICDFDDELFLDLNNEFLADNYEFVGGVCVPV